MAHYLNSRTSNFFPCGVCGAEVPDKALACPDCGADERTGLYGNEDPFAELALPATDEDFSYEEFMRREFGKSPRPHGLPWIWWVTGLLLLGAIAAGYCLLAWK